MGQCGGPGTTAAFAMLNDAVKKGGRHGGFVVRRRPVRRVHPRVRGRRHDPRGWDGALSLEKLEASDLRVLWWAST